MPTGERRRPPRGFTYLMLLFSLAIGGAAMATLGVQWQQAAQRERETELLFRGLQLRDALQRFHDQTPAGHAALPASLEALLTDPRRGEPRHHLRQLYADPFTGAADWVLLRTADGGIAGLRSRSGQALLRRVDLPPGVVAAASTAATGPGDQPLRASDLLFQVDLRRNPGKPTP